MHAALTQRMKGSSREKPALLTRLTASERSTGVSREGSEILIEKRV